MSDTRGWLASVSTLLGRCGLPIKSPYFTGTRSKCGSCLNGERGLIFNTLPSEPYRYSGLLLFLRHHRMRPSLKHSKTKSPVCTDMLLNRATNLVMNKRQKYSQSFHLLPPCHSFVKATATELSWTPSGQPCLRQYILESFCSSRCPETSTWG